jgi:serine/threonine protein kinase
VIEPVELVIKGTRRLNHKLLAKKYGKWSVVESLPEGGQAHTFLVIEDGDKDGKYFVLKRLKNLKRLGRFQLEIKAYNELTHPNLLKIKDYDLDTDKPYLVTEYCSGGALDGLDLDQYSLQARLSMFATICRGVGYAHAHEPAVVHRDLKPANIFLKEDKITPVVGDFGICHYKDGERMTVVDEVVGPLWYVAPELAHGLADDEDVTPAADVYSLGKLLYWMLNGRIFDREVHRTPRFDLTKGQTRPDYFFIYDLLDKTIVEDSSKRLSDANQVAETVQSIMRRIKMDAHHLDLSVPQACNYCGDGFYAVIFDSSMTKNAQDGLYALGINFSVQYGDWLIFRCNSCGNIQWFRPNFYDQQSGWKKK